MRDLKAIGARIRQRRKELGLNQAELAQRAGVVVTHLSNLECGTRPIGPRVAVRLACVLDIPAEELR